MAIQRGYDNSSVSRKVNLITNPYLEPISQLYYVKGYDSHGSQYNICLNYVPPGVAFSDIKQGQYWWVERSTTTLWSLSKYVSNDDGTNLADQTKESINTLNSVVLAGGIQDQVITKNFSNNNNTTNTIWKYPDSSVSYIQTGNVSDVSFIQKQAYSFSSINEIAISYDPTSNGYPLSILLPQIQQIGQKIKIIFNNLRNITTATPSTPSSGNVQYTTAAAHGFSVGISVTIAGFSPSGYNGTFIIVTVPTATTFTVANATTGTATPSLTTNATLTFLYSYSKSVTGATPSTPSSGNVQYTSNNHGFVPGQVVTIAGFSPSGYNGTFTIVTVPTSATFTVANATTGTATPTNATAIFDSYFNSLGISGFAGELALSENLSINVGPISILPISSIDEQLLPTFEGSNFTIPIGTIITIQNFFNPSYPTQEWTTTAEVNIGDKYMLVEPQTPNANYTIGTIITNNSTDSIDNNTTGFVLNNNNAWEAIADTMNSWITTVPQISSDTSTNTIQVNTVTGGVALKQAIPVYTYAYLTSNQNVVQLNNTINWTTYGTSFSYGNTQIYQGSIINGPPKISGNTMTIQQPGLYQITYNVTIPTQSSTSFASGYVTVGSNTYNGTFSGTQPGPNAAIIFGFTSTTSFILPFEKDATLVCNLYIGSNSGTYYAQPGIGSTYLSATYIGPIT